MHDRGFWLWPRESPALVPVRLFNLDGPRILAWLSADGRYSFERPAGVA
jgi:hypothetical protein